MLKPFNSAHSSSKIHLEEEKKKHFLSEQENQEIHISDDINKLRLQVNQKEKVVKMMDDKFLSVSDWRRKRMT